MSPWLLSILFQLAQHFLANPESRCQYNLAIYSAIKSRLPLPLRNASLIYQLCLLFSLHLVRLRRSPLPRLCIITPSISGYHNGAKKKEICSRYNSKISDGTPPRLSLPTPKFFFLANCLKTATDTSLRKSVAFCRQSFSALPSNDIGISCTKKSAP